MHKKVLRKVMDQKLYDNSLEAFNSIPEYADEVYKKLKMSSDCYKIGKNNEGEGIFSEGIDLFADLLELVEALKEIGALNEMETTQCTKKVAEFTSQLINAKESSDLVLFADLLEFESKDSLEMLKTLSFNNDFK
jgi:Rad3-related DNA helicase